MTQQYYPFASNEQLPTLSSVTKGIHSFEEAIQKTEFNFEYENLKSVYLANLPFIPTTISLALKEGIYLYRVRAINEKEEDIKKLDTFSYPPIGSTKQNRANLAGNPVLYCSLSGMAALKEYRINGEPISSGQELYLSVYKIKQDSSINYIQYLFPESIVKGALYEKINKRKLQQMKGLLKSYQPNKQKAVLKLTNYIAEKFLMKNDYSISSFLSHYYLYEIGQDCRPGIDAIVYPSVARDANDFNIALHPNAVDNKLELIEVQKLTFTNFVDNGAYVSSEAVGIPVICNGTIGWKELTLEETKVRLEKVKVRYTPTYPKEGRGIQRDFFIDENKFDFELWITRFILTKRKEDFLKIRMDGILQDGFTKSVPVRFPQNGIYSKWKNKKYYLKEAHCEFSYTLV